MPYRSAIIALAETEAVVFSLSQHLLEKLSRVLGGHTRRQGASAMSVRIAGSQLTDVGIQTRGPQDTPLLPVL